MEKQSKLTLTGLIVVILVMLFAISMIMPVLSKISKIEFRVICSTNLKGLGTAMYVYANDYDDNYPQLPGQGTWAKNLGFSYNLKKPDFETAQSNTSRTITASWYLLIRETDLSSRTFVCPESNQSEFYDSYPQNHEIIDNINLWDFGESPHNHVSYVYHNPYGKYPANKNRSSFFAVAADMNPWFQNGDVVQSGSDGQPPQLLKQFGRMSKKLAMNSNSTNHYYEGQNVLYIDSHVAWEKQPNIGVNNDNIYTFWSTEENPTEQDIQGGTAPTSRSPENDAKSKEDSFLAI